MIPEHPVRRLAIATTDGVDLRAEAAEPTTVSAAAVVCHPHPLHGGSMYANVVEALFRALPEHEVAVLRFNFRGTSGSTGRHDHGRAERLDVAAALDLAAHRWPGVPLLLAGYSFGADVSLAVEHPAVTARLAVAPILRVVERDELAGLDGGPPLWVVAAAHDQFHPYDELRAALDGADGGRGRIRVARVEGADHFFAVGLDQVVASGLEALGLAP